MEKKKILIIWDEVARAEIWQTFFEIMDFEVELCQYFDAFDFSIKLDLIIYHVDVVHNIDEKYKSGWRIGLELFKQHKKKLNCPVLFISTDTEDIEKDFQKELNCIDEEFEKIKKDLLKYVQKCEIR